MLLVAVGVLLPLFLFSLHGFLLPSLSFLSLFLSLFSFLFLFAFPCFCSTFPALAAAVSQGFFAATVVVDAATGAAVVALGAAFSTAAWLQGTAAALAVAAAGGGVTALAAWLFDAPAFP